MSLFRADSNEGRRALREIEERRSADAGDALRVADEAIGGVRERGDAYVREQVARFDEVTVDALCISPRSARIPAELAEAIEIAIQRVESFHRRQMPQGYTWTDGGTHVAHRVRPLRRVGLYVPGGGAVYLSTLIMTAVPATIAGVRELVVSTTPAAAARDELHYACRRLGIGEIYRAGGAAGIAALAFGTESLARVDKIVGPGNRYVTAAKSRVAGWAAGIDMLAGPTELVVIADESSDRRVVAAELAAQAEHGEDSAVICIWIGRGWDLPEATLNLQVADRTAAVELANRIAPEHLSIQTRDARELAEKADACGAVFCGPFSPVAAGDYIAGPNHVLPTGGSARFASPLGVYDFVKRSNVITITEEGLREIGPRARTLAEFEGLPQHARAVTMAIDEVLR